MCFFTLIIPTYTNAQSQLPEGVYEVDYRYQKDGTNETSAANGYLHVPNSGKLIVDEKGELTFQHEITAINKDYLPYLGQRLPGQPKAIITGQDIEGLDGYQEMTPLQQQDDRYIIQFKLENLLQSPDILMHVYMESVPGMPGGIYDYWYNAQLTIEVSDLPIEMDVDKTKLDMAITETEEFFKNNPPKGRAIENIISHGEHEFNSAILQSRFNETINIYNNPHATQAEVDTAINEINTLKELIVKNQFFLADSLRFIVLNSNDSTAEISEHASDFGTDAVTLIKSNSNKTIANIPVPKLSKDSEIKSAFNSANGGLDIYRLSKVYLIEQDNNENNYMQVNIRHEKAENWDGLSYIQYVDEGIEKEVYFSFNIEQLEILQDFVMYAESIVNGNTLSDESDAQLMNELITALNNAKEIANQLAAPRQHIVDATVSLKQAIFNFNDSIELAPGVYSFELAHSPFNELFSSLKIINLENGQIDLQLVTATGTNIVKISDYETNKPLDGSDLLYPGIDKQAIYQVTVETNGQEISFILPIPFHHLNLINENENESETDEGEDLGEIVDENKNVDETHENDETEPDLNEDPGENKDNTNESNIDSESDAINKDSNDNQNVDEPNRINDDTINKENQHTSDHPSDAAKGKTIVEENLSNTSEKSHSPLPNTATTHYLVFFMGCFCLFIGCIVYSLQRINNKKVN